MARSRRRERSAGSARRTSALASQEDKKPRSKLLSALGAVALLLVGAVLGVAVPRLFENIWPSEEIVGVSFIAYQNSSNGYSYFEVEPDWAEAARAYEACSEAANDISTLLKSRDYNACFNFEGVGGIPQFGGAFVDVTNPQSVSIQITEIRAVVDSRVEMDFAAKYEPPVGGDIGASLAFNLNHDNSRAVRVGTRADLPAVLNGDGEPYFGSSHFEIEPKRTFSFYTVPVSDFPGLVEWHLEIAYEAMDDSGERQRMFAVVAPPAGRFRGVPETVNADMVVDRLI